MSKRKTHDQFVAQASKLHNNKYTYPAAYIGDAIKINIECPIHGIFEQIPSSHLQGCGCQKCATEYTAILFRKNNENFLKEASIIHNNKYVYLEEYKGAKVKINIECPIHGTFLQAPDKHLQKNGCPECAGRVRKTTEQFINEARAIHGDKYEYPGKYINACTHIDIRCSKHGIFSQVPDTHLNGVGCPRCARNVSKPEIAWLDSLNIPNDNKHRSVRLKIGNSYIKPDGFIPETNTIYEFYGDYYHGNPEVFPGELENKAVKKTFGELYQATIAREQLIKQAGYNLVFIWEFDWKKVKNEQAKLQKDTSTPRPRRNNL